MAPPRHALIFLIAISFVSLSQAGPLGPLPNVTSGDLGLKEGSCALGDVVYMPGDEFPGSSPCEKCMCTAGDVKCSKQVCEQRPGCKALHRPDHCCPTYQCECEQEGRVYGNGEKLVDPVDPCRVCYCQGGEVVCRRIACFVRDDCTPRLVPGRCCPEYDNCPLRGVTNLPGMSSTASVSPAVNDAPPVPPKENVKQEITIKEITPVSEIPVITEVKIKEILPSPSIDVAEYSSSKSPLIPREATSEKNDKEFDPKTESPVSSQEFTNFSDNKDEDATPSKISFSAQDSINSSIYPSNVPIVATMGVPPSTFEPIPVATTKAPIIEEEDTFDHNPAFPPLPDDLAVLRNHEDEIVPEQVADNEHVSIHDAVTATTSPSPVVEVKNLETLTTSTTKDLPDTTTTATSEIPNAVPEATTLKPDLKISTKAPNFKESPMLNLRSAIPTEILNSPSIVPEEMNVERHETTTESEATIFPLITTTESPGTVQEITEKNENFSDNEAGTTESHPNSREIQTTATNIKIDPNEFRTTSEEDRTTPEGIITTSVEISTSETNKVTRDILTPAPKIESATTKKAESEVKTSTNQEEHTTVSIAKSNIATEVTSQTELSSLPVETSDQNPPEASEKITIDKVVSSTVDPFAAISKIPSSSEIITVSRAASNENTGFENVETTEFILTSFGSSETATDAVELIKISANPEKNAAIIESNDGKKDNVFTDLMNLISDVASMSEHTNEPVTVQHKTTTTRIPDSEELIPVNAGYKSKNKNFNQNSITEIPFKSKNLNTVNKQKVIEIEDDESESVTDAPPPNDKVEPTTRRPIIDNVSDGINISFNKTSKKDIEIITQSYVPTINRRPTKVVMQTNKEMIATDDPTIGTTAFETTSDTNFSSETTPPTTSAETSASAEMSPAIEPSIAIESSVPSVEPEPIVESKTRTSDLSVTTDRTDSTQ